jgi:hypothetical protein
MDGNLKCSHCKEILVEDESRSNPINAASTVSRYRLIANSQYNKQKQDITFKQTDGQTDSVKGELKSNVLICYLCSILQAHNSVRL